MEGTQNDASQPSTEPEPVQPSVRNTHKQTNVQTCSQKAQRAHVYDNLTPTPLHKQSLIFFSSTIFSLKVYFAV